MRLLRCPLPATQAPKPLPLSPFLILWVFPGRVVMLYQHPPSNTLAPLMLYLLSTWGPCSKLKYFKPLYVDAKSILHTEEPLRQGPGHITFN